MALALATFCYHGAMQWKQTGMLSSPVSSAGSAGSCRGRAILRRSNSVMVSGWTDSQALEPSVSLPARNGSAGSHS